MNTADNAPRRPSCLWLPIAGFTLALAAALAGLVAGPGTRWGWWDYRTGFAVLRFAAWGGVAAAAISLFAIVVGLLGRVRHSIVFGVFGFIFGALLFGVPWYLLNEGRNVPAIHDITTDTDDPPRFVAILPLRIDAPNTAEYGGPELARQQKQGYPDIAPLLLDVPPAAAYERALRAARAAGWDIVAAVPQENRIEATATTLMFGFKDDVVIRITATERGSRVDVRSVSRLGRSDLGANARRIRDYLHRISAG